ncbi:MAG: hypothetical protein WCI34_02590 [Actinomycetes bacterium]
MNRSRICLVLSLSTALALVAAPGASAVPVPDPTASIGATRGAGASGCVASSKVVKFTLNPLDSYYTFSGATVTLDGKRITSKTYAGLGGAGFGSPVRAFNVRVRLSALRAGRHRVKLVGTTYGLLGRHSANQASSVFVPGGPPLFRGTVTTTRVITKCATAFTG